MKYPFKPNSLRDVTVKVQTSFLTIWIATCISKRQQLHRDISSHGSVIPVMPLLVIFRYFEDSTMEGTRKVLYLPRLNKDVKVV